MITENNIIDLEISCCGIIRKKIKKRTKIIPCNCKKYKILYIFEPLPNERQYLNGSTMMELQCIDCGKKFWKIVDNKILEADAEAK